MLVGHVFRSRLRSRVGLHDYRSRDHGVIIAFFFGMSSDKRIIVKNYFQLGKKPPNPIGKRGGKPGFL